MSATLDDVRRVCLRLPGAAEGEGRFAFGVGGKGFCWTWMERVQPKKPRIENEAVLAVVVPGLGAKEVLAGAAWWVEDPHYRGFPAVLVRLSEIEVGELEELLTEGWRTKASKTMIAEFERGE